MARAWAEAAGALPCQRAFSIDDRLDRSGLPAVFASGAADAAAAAAGLTARQCGANAFAQFDDGAECPTARRRGRRRCRPTLCSAMYSSMLVGMSCFMESLIWRFSGSMARTCALTTWPARSTSLGMVDALVGADLADVDQAFDALGESARRRRSSSAW